MAVSSQKEVGKIAARPAIIDLFSGVGGLSLGAVRAGFEVLCAVDTDEHALAAHIRNFPTTRHLNADVRVLAADRLRTELGPTTLSGIVGGPPCQGFSLMGKRRKNDHRNRLFFHFFRLVQELSPLFFLAENVPGIMDENYLSLRQEAFALVEPEYNILNPIRLCASQVGAATKRERVFFIGFRKGSLILDGSDFVPKSHVQKATVRDALLGLPESLSGDKQGWCELQRVASEYLKRINRQPPKGLGDPESMARFSERLEVSGFGRTRHSAEVVERFLNVPQGKTEPISRFPRLSWDGFCPTLRAGTNKDRGSYQAARPIHPTQPRVIVTREAARLQGFPDWFWFDETKWHSFRQIGNSVSPLVAEAVFKVIRKRLHQWQN